MDFGTATTFDYISERGEYMGGVIAPGIMISCEALFQKASKLPRVEIFAKPLSILAKNTITLNAGIVYGYAGLVDGLVQRILELVPTRPRVIATGGLAPLIASELEDHRSRRRGIDPGGIADYLRAEPAGESLDRRIRLNPG